MISSFLERNFCLNKMSKAKGKCLLVKLREQTDIIVVGNAFMGKLTHTVAIAR